PALVLVKPGDAGEPAGQPGAAAWVEPPEPKVEVVAAPGFAPEALKALGLEGAESGRTEPLPGPVVTVRRGQQGRDRSRASELHIAFDSGEGSIAIDDDGPFFESDFRARGPRRLIAATPGHRPVVVVEPTQLAGIRGRKALLTLDGTALTVEGID